MALTGDSADGKADTNRMHAKHSLGRFGLALSQLRERRFRHHVGSRAPRWYAAVLSTLWTRRLARGGSRPQRGHWTTRFALPDLADVGRMMRSQYRSSTSISTSTNKVVHRSRRRCFSPFFESWSPATSVATAVRRFNRQSPLSCRN